VSVGQPGEIHIRAPNVCLGYWKNEAATQDCLSSDGWLKTGDIAVTDKDGNFWIVDRKKVGNTDRKQGAILIISQELIKVNALQVAPAELEAALLEHDGIADAACVGITL
jgi:4-coumarate--CoA ligase